MILQKVTLKNMKVLLLLLKLPMITMQNLEFNYSPFSNAGPVNWKKVDVTGNEWEKYVGQGHINLDIAGNECSSVRRPAPIPLSTPSEECKDAHEILTRQLDDLDCKIDDVEFSINPHFLRASFPETDDFCERPTIDMSFGYPWRFMLKEMEVHLRSEHVLDGRRFDGEIQMIHLGQQDQFRELSTVSVLLDASGEKEDKRFQELIDHWENAKARMDRRCDRRLNEGDILKRDEKQNKRIATPNWRNTTSKWSVDAPEHNGAKTRSIQSIKNVPRNRMFPYNLWPTIYYYGYRGSLTSPPCSEIVSYRILDEPLQISRRQYKQLASLQASYLNPNTCDKGTKVSETGENWRYEQEFNPSAQELKHCTSEDFSFWLYPPDEA